MILMQVDDTLEDKAVVPLTIATNFQTVVCRTDIFQHVEGCFTIRPEGEPHEGCLGIVSHGTLQQGDVGVCVDECV